MPSTWGPAHKDFWSCRGRITIAIFAIVSLLSGLGKKHFLPEDFCFMDCIFGPPRSVICYHSN